MVRFFLSCALLSSTGFAETADLVITARHVLTMNGTRQVIENGAVAVRGERIVAVGSRADIDKEFQSKQRIDGGASVIMPGLINTHNHAAMVLFRGIADDRNLQDWLEHFIFPAEAKNVTPEFVRVGTRLACAEMLLSGTTTYADMYYFEDIVADATRQCGMRGVLGESSIGFPVPDAKTPAEGLKRAESFIQRYRNDSLITPAVAPHALYTVPDDLLKSGRALANRYGVPLLIHVSETKKENDDISAKRKTTPVQLLEALGALSGRTLIAHGVWVNDEDIRVLKKRNVGVAHCPSSNMKLASGVAPVARYLQTDVAVGLGTDGPAGSNNDLNLFEEIDLAGKLQKVITADPTVLTAKQAVEMATIRGARALGLEKEVGSLEPGKRADLIVIALTAPHAVPMYDLYSHVASVLKGSDVRHVVVNGRVVVRDRRVLTIDVSQAIAAAQAMQRSVQRTMRP